MNLENTEIVVMMETSHESSGGGVSAAFPQKIWKKKSYVPFQDSPSDGQLKIITRTKLSSLLSESNKKIST